MADLGASDVIDYTTTDFADGSRRFDVIFDLVGNRTLGDCRRALKDKGTLVLSSGPPSPTIRRILKALAINPFVSQRLVPLAASASVSDLETLGDWVANGDMVPVIGRQFTFDEVLEAVQYRASGESSGTTLVTL